MVDNKISIGSSGEYYAAYTLERHGFTAAMPMANTKNFDILAINRETNKQIAVQVKTTAKHTHTWPLSSKSETLKGKNIFYFLFFCTMIKNLTCILFLAKLLLIRYTKIIMNGLRLLV